MSGVTPADGWGIVVAGADGRARWWRRAGTGAHAVLSPPRLRPASQYPHRVLGATVGLSTGMGVILVVAGLALSWLLTILAGGAGPVVPHWYYLPVILAAVRFGHGAALLTGIVAGVLAGPLSPQYVDGWVAQAPSEWLTRGMFFVLVGQVAAVLVRPSLPSLGRQLQRLRLDRSLRAALARDELFVRFQPIVALPSGHLAGVEALVRWHGPDGEVPAGQFMPLAESCPVIHELGAMVLREACAQAVRWEALVGPAQAPYVSVNLSAAEIDSPELIERVRSALDASGLNPRRLCLEVTETALVEDFDGSVDRLRRLKELGVAIAIDDFGTGYSSLSYVHRFPADVLKIDRSFVNELDTDPQSEAIIGGLVLLGRSLGLRVIAEGVEHERQAEQLAALGCSHFQGFHYARPSTADVVTALLLGEGRFPVGGSCDRVLGTAERAVEPAVRDSERPDCPRSS